MEKINANKMAVLKNFLEDIIFSREKIVPFFAHIDKMRDKAITGKQLKERFLEYEAELLVEIMNALGYYLEEIDQYSNGQMSAKPEQFAVEKLKQEYAQTIEEREELLVNAVQSYDDLKQKLQEIEQLI